jgi:hypothetical protein
VRTVQGWRKAAATLERWRRNLTRVEVRLKRPRVIDIVPVDYLSGEPSSREGIPQQRFQGKLVFFTKDDATLRRPAGALLIIDTYEVESLTDGKTRVVP